ncbi:MAG: hypothetical protein KME57_34565 [Scytonema hyalinum WJT4-NPBG1]|jgi:hypothetical protein|nr:hypothetical protein [Scytonema hyalinum WJT4-NPBG1]
MTETTESHAQPPHHAEVNGTLHIPNFPTDLYKRLEVAADSLGVTMTDLLTAITEEWLVRNQ